LKVSRRIKASLLVMILAFVFGFYLSFGYHAAMAIVAAPEIPTVSKPEEKQPVETVEPVKVYLGKFVVTGYCPCERCTGKRESDCDYGLTASMTEAREGMTVGADPGLFEFGETILIEGMGERTIEDIPAARIMKRYRGHIIDLYLGTHEEAQAFGKQELDVWLIKEARNGN